MGMKTMNDPVSIRAEFAKVREQRKYELIERDGMACHYCDCLLVDTPERSSPRWYGKLTVDHVVPVSAGGSNKLSNLVLACQECNSRKRDKPYHAPKAKMYLPPGITYTSRITMSFLVRMLDYFDATNGTETEGGDDKLTPEFVSGMLKGFKR
jgi:hypothetical protein